MRGSGMSFLQAESSDDFAGELLCSRLRGGTDVTGSAGLSEGFADELEAENNLPSPFGTHLWGRKAARGVRGRSAWLSPGAGALPGCSHCPRPVPAWEGVDANVTAVKIKSAHRILPGWHGRAPGARLGVREHRWVSPGLPAGLSALLPGFHTALYFQVNALPLLTASPALSQAGWHYKPTARRGRGSSGCCPPAAGAGKATRAALDAPGVSAAPIPAGCGAFPPLVLGQMFSP